jgi:hypothetical protein
MTPLEERVYTEEEAREQFGFPRTPREIYGEQEAARAAGQGPTPYQHDHHDPLLTFDTAGEAGGTLTR